MQTVINIIDVLSKRCALFNTSLRSVSQLVESTSCRTSKAVGRRRLVRYHLLRAVLWAPTAIEKDARLGALVELQEWEDEPQERWPESTDVSAQIGAISEEEPGTPADRRRVTQTPPAA